MQQTDFLVIGSGVAGLTYALNVAQRFPKRTVTVITKTDISETNTKYAQGGVAVVNDLKHDSYEKHIQDTLIAGDGLCNEEIVEIVVKEGPASVEDIIKRGAHFDKNTAGEYTLGREGGHSENRVIHHKDITGKEIERALVSAVKEQKNIKVISHCYVVDLITQHHLGYLVTKSTTDIECYGVYVLNCKTNRIEKILARITLLATGGNGQVYRTTTNPTIATGDGVAMLYRAKGRIENMEFIQFHPTALYSQGGKEVTTGGNIGQDFLISEAVRGDGAVLRNKEGAAFMKQYDERADLAPRDVVARAIDNEMKKSGMEHVFLDCRKMDMGKFKAHFPTIYEKCLSIGVNVAKDMIPVAPAAHYSCGGIKTDEWGRSSIRNLYACGECASTGLHGANRLASNSLLEAMVFARRCFEDSAKNIDSVPICSSIPDWNATGTTAPREMILITQSIKELQQVMSDYVGIVRSNTRLQRAMRRLDILHEETEALYEQTVVSPQLCQVRNLITVGYLIVKGASFRKESRGLHYNTDYPDKSELVQNIIL